VVGNVNSSAAEAGEKGSLYVRPEGRTPKKDKRGMIYRAPTDGTFWLRATLGAGWSCRDGLDLTVSGSGYVGDGE
jgi:hypothetical protein